MSTEKKADFSGVTATVDSTEQKAADFSGVTATVDSTEEIVGERTYTIEVTGTTEKLDSFLQALTKSLILETVRTGAAGIGRGERMLRI